MLDEPGFLKKLACSLVEKVSKAQPLGRVDSVLSFEEAEVFRASGQIYECHFTRLRISGITYHTLLWREPQKRHNCTIMFSKLDSNDCGYGQIESFIQHHDTFATNLSALVRVFDCSAPFPNVQVSGLYAAKPTTKLVLLDILRLLS